VPGLGGVDTRALTRRLRERGALRAVLVQAEKEPDVGALVERARAVRPIGELDLVTEASIPARYQLPADGPAAGKRVVVLDCGIKQNILRSLGRRGLDTIVVPHATTSAEILALSPDGIVVGNGPGDPTAIPQIAETVRGLMMSDV